METAKVALFSLLVAAPFLAVHFVASAYSEPKAPAEECAKPYSPPGARSDLMFGRAG